MRLSRLKLRPTHLPHLTPKPTTTTTTRIRMQSTAAPGHRSFPAWFVRGGTSNGLAIRRDALPPESHWPSILPAAMGSPDPHHARQLDGLGSGVSSTSKIVVLALPEPNAHPARHVDYTFVQVGIRDGTLDTAGNCGNMSSVVGPAAWDMGLVAAEGRQRPEVKIDEDGVKWATLRLFNTNTQKIVASTFRVDGEPLVYSPVGEYEMDGVPGCHSCITMEFLDPAGAKTGKALPTGNAVDTLQLPDGLGEVQASLVDVGNPGVFVTAASVGLQAPCTPADIEADAPLKEKLQHIRRAGASAMGLDPDIESVPKIVLLFPADTDTADDGVDIRCLAMSMGQAHRAVPLTLALCLGAATKIEGTLAEGMLAGERRDAVTIAHPSGRLDVGTRMEGGKIVAAQLLRTARVMMKGDVFY